MARRMLSPRLASLVADNDEIRDAVLQGNVLTTQDLVALAPDADEAATKLRIPEGLRRDFAEVFDLARTQRTGQDEGRMQLPLDVVNAEGQLIMMRSRDCVHRQGFLHRAVNVWVVCTSTWQVLLGQRSAGKDHDARKWTCVCGRIGSGELSQQTALERLADEFSIRLQDHEVQMIFSMKVQKPMTNGVFAGQQDSTLLDVYVACLEQEIPIHRILLNVQAKQAVKYVPLDELGRAFTQQDDGYVQPPTDEYGRKLIHYLRKTCEGSALSARALPQTRKVRELAVAA